MCTPACEHHLYPTSTAWAPSLCSLLSPAGSSASCWPQLWLCLTCGSPLDSSDGELCTQPGE